MEMLKTINFIIAVIFFVCYTYQFLYIPVPWLRKEKPHGPAKANRYAVLICARNEQRVIGDLIASLRGQTYDQSLLSIFVLADNCTDDTAMVARVAGAHVYERFNRRPAYISYTGAPQSGLASRLPVHQTSGLRGF